MKRYVVGIKKEPSKWIDENCSDISWLSSESNVFESYFELTERVIEYTLHIVFVVVVVVVVSAVVVVV